MSRAVRFAEYGDVDVLHIADVPIPEAADGQVVVRVRAAGVSTGEVKIRSGAMDKMAPAHFPEGEGTEFAGVVRSVGRGVEDFEPDDEVIGFADIRGAQADYVPAPTTNVLKKPAGLDWDTAAAAVSPGATAISVIDAVAPKAGETIVVAGASGGVGVVAVQLAVRAGARVIATASEPNHEYLRGLGAEPVAYGEGVEERIRRWRRTGWTPSPTATVTATSILHSGWACRWSALTRSPISRPRAGLGPRRRVCTSSLTSRPP